MKSIRILIVVASAGLISSCAATIPRELVNARETYRRVSTGSTAQIAPAELHVANQALGEAEKSFRDNPESYRTRDLAYVAQRKAEMAEVTASITTVKKSQTQAEGAFQAAQGNIVANAKQDLSQARNALTAEQAARAAAEKQAADALAKLAAVREEPRGMVITLSGSVLFASNQATLLPEARTRLDQVAVVLLTTRERNITIEGHTDSQGSDSHNVDLSQRRADAVRNYIVQQGYQADRITAHGLGEVHPVADNANAEGRANNRRVEIIIEHESHASN